MLKQIVSIPKDLVHEIYEDTRSIIVNLNWSHNKLEKILKKKSFSEEDLKTMHRIVELMKESEHKAFLKHKELFDELGGEI